MVFQGPERLTMKLQTPVQVASLLVEKYAHPIFAHDASPLQITWNFEAVV